MMTSRWTDMSHWHLQSPRAQALPRDCSVGDGSWATEAIAFRCDDGEIVETAGGCTDLSDPVPIDGLGNERPDGPVADCCAPAPAIMQFDSDGNLLNAWGGPADPGFVGQADGIVNAVCDPDDGCQWPAGEHGLYVDHNGFVHLAGNGTGTGDCGGNPCPWAGTHGADAMVLKFAADGTFIYQIGDPDPVGPDSNDTAGASNGTPQPVRPADMEVDPETNELYLAASECILHTLRVDCFVLFRCSYSAIRYGYFVTNVTSVGDVPKFCRTRSCH